MQSQEFYFKVARGEAELLLPMATCDHADIQVSCSQPLKFQPLRWISKYPQPTSKLWNIRDLFTPGGWAMLVLTFCIMIGFFRITKMLFPLHSPMSLAREELPLVFTL